jgi:hypothetical protein
VSESAILGLRPRPEPDLEVLAVVTAAVEELTRPRAVAVRPAPSLAWKQSGRWFAGHQVRLRGRPF